MLVRVKDTSKEVQNCFGRYVALLHQSYSSTNPDVDLNLLLLLLLQYLVFAMNFHVYAVEVCFAVVWCCCSGGWWWWIDNYLVLVRVKLK